MNLERIETLQAKSRQLTEELKQSLHIRRLWPEAFHHGAVTVALVGPKAARPGEMKFLIRRCDGQERTFVAVLDPGTKTWQLPEGTK